MKNNESGNRDESLDALLEEWRIHVSLAPGFQEGVWRRVEAAERNRAASMPSFWGVMANWIETMLLRPSLAASCAAIILAVGLTAGWAQARRETARVSDELSARYVQSVDPYLAAR